MEEMNVELDAFQQKQSTIVGWKQWKSIIPGRTKVSNSAREVRGAKNSSTKTFVYNETPIHPFATCLPVHSVIHMQNR
ncbi:hypothetical protein AB6A40_001174 [Gnathostoma spinigerum]|uniref:Uncharacterized protein n=1 Tax=Gnathostoma spinigerum TaxID=75299 RepID=A0ABD6E3L8_9BILA